MSKLLMLICLLIAVACNNDNKIYTHSDEANSTAADRHNRRISVELAGVYKGILPCADCAGIETNLIL